MLDPKIAAPVGTVRTGNLNRPPHEYFLLPLEAAILQTVAYADVFDYPLTSCEIHKYLVGYSASYAAVKNSLASQALSSYYLERHGEFHTLPGRAEVVERRLRNTAASEKLWPAAKRYGRLIAKVPFVRMVAVTGALAVNNAAPGDDIDYFIITEPDRLWLCRALVILLVKQAARVGILLCPNYFLAEDALALSDQDLFTAHELLQMTPISGSVVYKKMIHSNSWAARFLPNAFGDSLDASSVPSRRQLLVMIAETVLRTPPGTAFERWEMERKISKFTAQRLEQHRRHIPPDADFANLVELSFGRDRCKGHFNHHGSWTLQAYQQRLQLLNKGRFTWQQI